MQRLYLDFKLISLNEYIKLCRGNKYAAAEAKKDIQQEICWEIKKQELTTINAPVRLKFTWYETNKRRDKDNVAFAKKFILDALQAVEVLPNDNNKWVLGFTDDFIYSKKQGVIIEIEEV